MQFRIRLVQVKKTLPEHSERPTQSWCGLITFVKVCSAIIQQRVSDRANIALFFAQTLTPLPLNMIAQCFIVQSFFKPKGVAPSIRFYILGHAQKCTKAPTKSLGIIRLDSKQPALSLTEGLFPDTVWYNILYNSTIIHTFKLLLLPLGKFNVDQIIRADDFYTDKADRKEIVQLRPELKDKMRWWVLFLQM